MRDFNYDIVEGVLGRPVKRHQKTLKRKVGKIPWKEVRVSGSGKCFVSLSFDGSAYTDELILQSGEIRLPVAAIAVRVRVTRASDKVSYTLFGRD